MQGHIVQAQALVVLGNAALQGGSAAPLRWPDDIAFDFCSAIDFFAPAPGPSAAPVRWAADPGEWIERLRADGVIGLRLQHAPPADARLPQHEAVAFANGGGAWPIEAIKPLWSELWFHHWTLGDRDRPDQRIWRVRYTRGDRGVSRMPSPSSAGDLEITHAALGAVLQRIAAFADAQGLANFAECFRRGLAALESASPLERATHADERATHADRSTAWLALPLAARQLRAASNAAWVFGGMGSWNDVGFDGDAQAEYEQLTGELWRALNHALLLVAESSFDPTGRRRAHPRSAARFVVSQEPGNISTIDYGRLHAVAYDRAIHAQDESDGGVRLRIERFAGPVLVTLRPQERERLAALELPTREVQPPWCEDAASNAPLVVEPAGESSGGWRIAYGVFEAPAAHDALAIGTAGLASFLLIDAVAAPVTLRLPAEVAQLDAGSRAYTWPEQELRNAPPTPDNADPSAFERIGPNAARHRDGWSVSRTGRYTMRYEAGPRAIEAEVDPGTGADGRADLVLYADSLIGWMSPRHHEPFDAGERDRIARRMVEANAFLGQRVVLA